MRKLIDLILAAVTIVTAIVFGAVLATRLLTPTPPPPPTRPTQPIVTVHPGDSIIIPAPPSERPTEPAPVVDLRGIIVDAVTGEPVTADVQVGKVAIEEVSEFRVILPADSSILIEVVARGYCLWRVELTPHIKRSKTMIVPVKLTPRPETGCPTPAPFPPQRSGDET